MSVVWQKGTHGVPIRHEKINPIMVRFFAIAGAVVGVFLGLYLALSASTIRLSAEVWTMHNELSAIQRENSRLETEVARNCSIPILQQRSEVMGYLPVEALEYLDMGMP